MRSSRRQAANGPPTAPTGSACPASPRGRFRRSRAGPPSRDGPMRRTSGPGTTACRRGSPSACRRCARLAPSDQALLVCNAVADALAPDVRLFHLAYHDTLPPPESVRPAPGVSAEFAPRERCYAHPLDDPACVTNRPYRQAFERHLEHFAGRVHVFEYYGDAILFGGCAVPLVDVCGRDLEYYRRAGARGVSCLTFG